MMEIDALMSNAESMQSLRTLEASLGLKEGEGIDGILWPPSHPLLAPEVLPTDAVSSSSFFLSSSNESSSKRGVLIAMQVVTLQILKQQRIVQNVH